MPSRADRSFLVDTHVWLWMLVDDPRLGRRARELLTDAGELLLSAASVWEISIEVRSGRLTAPLTSAAEFRERMQETGVVLLPIDLESAASAGSLPPHHRDPFDRMLVAQARLRGIPLVSADERLAAYDVDLIVP